MARKKPPVQAKPPGPGLPADIHVAPHDLRIVQAFLCTAPAGERQDLLASPEALVRWLEAWKLVPPGLTLTDDDLRRVHRARAALLGLTRGNNTDATLAADAVQRFDEAFEGARFGVRGTDGPGVRFETRGDGVDAALARFVEIVALQQDEWARLKLCANPDCRNAFFDSSTSDSARWCRPRCGNTLSARRARKRRGRSATAFRVAEWRRSDP